MSEEASWIPEALRDEPYFRATEDGVERTTEQVIADLRGVAQLQGDLTKSHIKIPDKDDAEAVSTALKKAMQFIPGITVIPGDGDTEAQDAFYKSIGRPDDIDGYQLPEVADGVLEGVNLEQIKEQALADGWTQSQFAKFVKRVESERVGMSDAQRTQVDENRASLQAEWGAAYADRREELAAFLKTDNGVPEDIVNAFTADQLSPDTVKWLHGMARAVASEDTQLSGQQSGSHLPTPSEAAEQLPAVEAKLYAMKNTDPGFDAALKKQERLLRLIRGEKLAG